MLSEQLMNWGSFCVTSFEGRTVNSYWLCQRRWKSTRRGGLITNECFGSYFFNVLFWRFLKFMLRREMWGSIRDPFKEQMELHSTSHESTLLRLVYTHTLTHTSGLLPWRLKQQRTHTGISQDNKTLRREFCLVFGILMHFLYIDYFFYFVLFSDLKVRGYGIISDVFSSCITCHPHHFSLSMWFPVHPYDCLNCPPHITAHRKGYLFDQLDSV